MCSHSALEILHDIQEMIVHLWFVLELDLNCVKIAESISDIERPLLVWIGRHWIRYVGVALLGERGRGRPWNWIKLITGPALVFRLDRHGRCASTKSPLSFLSFHLSGCIFYCGNYLRII
jgi:hypothetical protein